MNNEYGIENYEELFAELSGIKNDLINPNIKLSDAISKVKRGKQVYAILNAILDKAEQEVEKITEINTNPVAMNSVNNFNDINFDNFDNFDINNLGVDTTDIPF